MQVKKILIANRGEIAVRIARSAKEMGIKTVGIFSEADRNAVHIRFMDEAVYIGEALPAKSYLRGDKIIEAAKKLNADAIHPGYGFLSENPAFAKAVAEAGLIFIGPPYQAMEKMGSKIEAKITAKKLNVPLVPGTESPIQDLSEAKKIAHDIGFPVLIKASAGGGGKGMRVVDKMGDFDEQAERAMSEARTAFGDGSVFIEKYVRSPRHIEFQILGDQHGNYVHLFERECSIQRRHQKLIEETPSSLLNDELRSKMGGDAIALAKAVGYYNAGTVEFLVDENLNYYFLEMNTRLQVEHPVTEYITGLDLVKEQIHVADGEKLSFTQDDLKMNGHAIELRVCAEDPQNQFLPDSGNLSTYIQPKGIGVRIDDGVEENSDIPIFYDSLIAKLIVHAGNREEAIQRMIRAIDEFQVSGIHTTLEFGKWVMKHEKFREGKFDTGFISKYFNPDDHEVMSEVEEKIAAVLAAKIFNEENKTAQVAFQNQGLSSWQMNRSR